MKYPFEQLDYCIYTSVCPRVLIKAIEEGTYTLDIWHDALSVDETIKINLIREIHLLKKKKHMRHSINVAHASCIRHIMTLSTYIRQISSVETIKPQHQDAIKNYLLLQNKMYGLVSFIEENFGMYTHFKDSPCQVNPDILNNYRQRFARIKLKLTNRCTDKTLLAIALGSLEDFFSTTSPAVYKYERYFYLKEYIFYLEKVCMGNEKVNLDINLKNCMLFLNYNHFSFVNYIIQQLRCEIHNLEHSSLKIEQWLLHSKEFKQLNHLPKLALFPSSPSVKKQLVQKIKCEIKYLRSQRLEITAAPLTAVTNKEKISTSLSVPQLALFIRLLMDTEILQPENRSAIFRKIAASVSTAKTGSISEESLRSKFYAPQNTSAKILKEYLLKMMNLLRGYVS